MVLGKLPVPGRPTIWITVGQGPTALAVGAGGGCVDIFTLIYPFSPLSPSLWETARYRLKYCLKGPLNPKQPTNQKPRRADSSKYTERIICKKKCSKVSVTNALDGSYQVFLQQIRFYSKIFGNKHCRYKEGPLYQPMGRDGQLLILCLFQHYFSHISKMGG